MGSGVNQRKYPALSLLSTLYNIKVFSSCVCLCVVFGDDWFSMETYSSCGAYLGSTVKFSLRPVFYPGVPSEMTQYVVVELIFMMPVIVASLIGEPYYLALVSVVRAPCLLGGIE